MASPNVATPLVPLLPPTAPTAPAGDPTSKEVFDAIESAGDKMIWIELHWVEVPNFTLHPLFDEAGIRMHQRAPWNLRHNPKKHEEYVQKFLARSLCTRLRGQFIAQCIPDVIPLPYVAAQLSKDIRATWLSGGGSVTDSIYDAIRRYPLHKHCINIREVDTIC